MAQYDFEFKGVVRFTRIGWVYLAFTLFVGFAALNTGNNSLYITLSFMLGVLILSGAASHGAIRALEIEVEPVGEVWAGQPSCTGLRVWNRSRIWSLRDLVIVSPSLASAVVVPRLGRRLTKTVEAELFFQIRGMVRLTSIDAYTRFPFGFFLKKRRVRIEGEAIVYPRLLSEIESEEQNFSSGDLAPLRKSGAGSEIYAFREYVRGDSLRHIHWKKSANVGRWIIMQPESEAQRSVVVAVDLTKPPGTSAEEFETLISAATTFVRDALLKDLEVHLYLANHQIVGRGSSGSRAMFEALALAQPTSERPHVPWPAAAVVFAIRRPDARLTA